jgi:hypothetical protein
MGKDAPDELHTQYFADLAKKERQDAIALLRGGRDVRLGYWASIVRTLDAASLQAMFASDKQALFSVDYTLLNWGWNAATAQLLGQETGATAAPSQQRDSSSMPVNPRQILERLGRSVLFQRASEMLRKRLATVQTLDDDKLVFRSIDATNVYYLDRIDNRRLAALMRGLHTSDPDVLSYSWTYASTDDREELEKRAGNYFLVERGLIRPEALRPDIDELMKPLIRVHDTPSGPMISYDSTEEVRDHFDAVATQLADDWWSESGLHPEARIFGVSGEAIMLVAALMISRHLAHIRYVQLAAGLYPEISVATNMTHVTSRKRYEDKLLGYIESKCDFDLEEACAAFDAITLRANEAEKLDGLVTPLVPLIVDVGNDRVVMPVSSIFRNPFLTIVNLQELRNASAINAIQKPREGWMRSSLYSLFDGNRYRRRYECVGRPTRVRVGGMKTDIDAAVFDRTSGELALFELKWQNLQMSDIAALSSRACNLSARLREWVGKVRRWREHRGDAGIAQALRLDTSAQRVSAIYLFAISQTAVRVGAFRQSLGVPELAVANWSQFVRLKHDIGPVPNAIRKMHEALTAEHEALPEIVDLPFTVRAGDKSVLFENLWVGLGTDSDGLVAVSHNN